MFLDQSMLAFEQQVLKKYPADTLTDEDTFCQSVAEIQGEFLTIHPFREGNARTIKLMTDLLAAQTGRPLLNYEKSDGGRDAYIAAANTAFMRNYEPLTVIIRAALAEAQK
jgi:cell filamentation protein